MTETPHQLLRRIAASATGGDWFVDVDEKSGNVAVRGIPGNGKFRLLDMTSTLMRLDAAPLNHGDRAFPELDAEVLANAEYVAAARPAVVTALLDEISALKTSLSEAHARAVKLVERLDKALAQKEAVLEALRNLPH